MSHNPAAHFSDEPDAALPARVLQAMGMVSVQAHCSVDDALAMMRDRATVEHRTLTEIAEATLDRSIWFGL
jgi:AmiR/NasT family two-component response regulator